MTAPSLPERLRAQQSEIAQEALLRLYRRHPGLEARFGAAGRRTCLEDIGHHLNQLATAVASADPASFRAYLSWLADVLEHRGISRSHLADSLADLDAVLTERLPAAEQALVTPLIAAGVAEVNASAPAPLFRLLPEPLPLATPFTEALLAGGRRSALEIARSHLEDGGNLLGLYGRVIQPSLYQVGQLWQENRISVAQEHLATAVAQHVMALAYDHGEFTPPSGRHALAACVETNHHTLGLRMVADLLEQRGWEVAYLGANTPTLSLVAQVENLRPELVALSVSQVEQLEVAREVVNRLRTSLGEACPHLLAGGIVLNQVDTLWRQTGADLWLPHLEALDAWLG